MARKGFLLPILLALASFVLPAGANTGSKNEAGGAANGAQIFHGQVPLRAKLAGHTQALPSQATRCENCHAGDQPLAQILGGRLGQKVARRGGPPSRFEASSLCRLLREGIDPAHIVINTTMPRYDISNAQCLDLWAYLEAPRKGTTGGQP